jgi:hypothetical protein
MTIALVRSTAIFRPLLEASRPLISTGAEWIGRDRPMLLKKDFGGGPQAILIQDQRGLRKNDSKYRVR